VSGQNKAVSGHHQCPDRPSFGKNVVREKEEAGRTKKALPASSFSTAYNNKYVCAHIMLGSSLRQTIKCMSAVPTLKTTVLPGFLLQANFRPISICTKDFSWKKMAQIHKNLKYIQIARFFRVRFRSSQERRRILYICFYFHI